VAKIQVLDMLETRSLFLLSENPGDVQFHPWHAHLLIVREQDGRLTVGLLFQATPEVVDRWRTAVPDRLSHPLRCRAFIFEQEVLTRMAAIALKTPEEKSPERLLLPAFQPEMVASNFEVARLLVGVAELEGEIDPDKPAVCFCRLEIPDWHHRFHPRIAPPQVVVIADTGSEEGG